jgi:hypothetical protein
MAETISTTEILQPSFIVSHNYQTAIILKYETNSIGFDFLVAEFVRFFDLQIAFKFYVSTHRLSNSLIMTESKIAEQAMNNTTIKVVR